jgi:hypothetical protein
MRVLVMNALEAERYLWWYYQIFVVGQRQAPKDIEQEKEKIFRKLREALVKEAGSPEEAKRLLQKDQ